MKKRNLLGYIVTGTCFNWSVLFLSFGPCHALKWLHGAGKRCMYCIMKCNISPRFGLLMFYALCIFLRVYLHPFCLMKFYSMSGFGMGPGLRERGMKWWEFASEIVTIFLFVWFLSYYPLCIPQCLWYSRTHFGTETLHLPSFVSLKYVIAPYRSEQVERDG